MWRRVVLRSLRRAVAEGARNGGNSVSQNNAVEILAPGQCTPLCSSNLNLSGRNIFETQSRNLVGSSLRRAENADTSSAGGPVQEFKTAVSETAEVSKEEASAPSAGGASALSSISSVSSAPEVGSSSGGEEAAAGEGRVAVRLTNAPKYVLKYEILRFFSGCNLAPEDVFGMVDDRIRLQYWCLMFPTRADFERARILASEKLRIGNRTIRIEELSGEEQQRVLTLSKRPSELPLEFRGTSLLMIGVPEEVKTDSIERFFQGFALAPFGIRHFRALHENVRTPMRNRAKGDTRASMDVLERRTVIKFQNPAEALRALREKQREFLEDRAVEMRLIQ